MDSPHVNVLLVILEDAVKDVPQDILAIPNLDKNALKATIVTVVTKVVAKDVVQMESVAAR